MRNASADYPVHVHVVAEHQLFSESEGWLWMNQMLEEAVDAGKIQTGKVLDSSYGPFGLQLVLFSVDLFIPACNQAGAKKYVRKLLNKVVGDTDVNVRWISPLAE